MLVPAATAALQHRLGSRIFTSFAASPFVELKLGIGYEP